MRLVLEHGSETDSWMLVSLANNKNKISTQELEYYNLPRIDSYRSHEYLPKEGSLTQSQTEPSYPDPDAEERKGEVPDQNKMLVPNRNRVFTSNLRAQRA